MKVMVCYDGSERTMKALEKTIELFSPQKPEIVLITVAEEPLLEGGIESEAFTKLRSEKEEYLRKAAEWVRDRGYEVETRISIGDPRKVILDAAGTVEPDILVVARRDGDPMDRMVLGSVSAFLVRHASCPVLVMHGE